MLALQSRGEDRNVGRAFKATFLGFTIDALDVQLYAFFLPTLATLWSLTQAHAGFLASATLIASAVGGWVAGALADRFGRLRVLKFTVCWFAAATILAAFAQNSGQFLLARVCQGLGFGGEWAVGAVFIGEMAPAAVRGRLMGLAQSAWAVGWGLAATLSALTLAFLPTDIGWRVAFVAGGLPALLIFVLRSRLDETEIFRNEIRPASWRGIFSGNGLPATLKGSLLTTGMHSGYWALATWLPSILRTEREFSLLQTSFHLGVLIIGSFLGYVVGSWISDRLGRRVTLMTFAFGGAVCALTYTQLPLSSAALLVMGVPLGFFASGIFSAVGPVLTELYPTHLRGSGLGFCYNLGRALAGVAPVLIGSGAAAFGLARLVGLYAAAAYGVVLIAVCLLSETRGKNLGSPDATGVVRTNAGGPRA